MEPIKKPVYALNALLLAAPLLLLALILFSPHHPFYDEYNFVGNLPLIAQHGLSLDFLRGIRNQSPGPLFQLIYYPLQCIGITSIVGFRVVNYLMLCGCIYLLYHLLPVRQKSASWWKALLLFSLPLTWPTGGLALTEVPTVFCSLLSLAAVQAGIKARSRGLLLVLASGLLAGLAAAGRTQFLMVIPAVAWLLYVSPGIKWTTVAAYCVAALVLPISLFLIWKGLVPPHVQGIQSGIKPLFVAYTFGYTCFFVVLFYPAWYRVPAVWYRVLVALLLVSFALNLLVFHYEFIPMKSLMKHLPGSVAVYANLIIGALMPCIMCCLGVLHVIGLGYQVARSRHDYWAIMLLLAATLIALTTIKSAAQFSTRYPYQAIPFLLLYCAPYIVASRWLLLRVCIGMALGVVSIWGYYHIP